MTTDRELLELAAKAAGIQIKLFNSNGHPVIAQDGGGPESCLVTLWNPLVDDGQALRLAITLEIGVVMYRYDACGEDLQVEAESKRYACQESTDTNGGDKFAATRRAILRAAAEIGRAMP